MKSKEFLVFLFFFMVSAFFWVLLAVKDVAERDISVKIVMVNHPEGVVFCTDGCDSIRVTVRDNGYNILSYLTFLNKVRPVEVDFKKYADTDNNMVIVSNLELLKLLKTQLEKSTEVVAAKPEKLEIAYYDEKDCKKMAVIINGDIRPREPYFISSKRVYPDSVIVYGPKLSPDTIPTKFIRITDFTENVSLQNVSVKKSKYMVVEPSEVTIEVIVDINGEDSLDVPITAINEPEGIRIKVHQKKVRVKFVAPSSKTDIITPEQFKVFVDYNDVDSKNNGNKLPLHKGEPPQYVNNYTFIEDSVAYSIDSNHEKE